MSRRVHSHAGLLILGLASSLRAGSPAVDFGAGISSLGHLSAQISAGWTRGDLYQAVKVHVSGELFPPALPEETMVAAGFQAGPYWNHSFAFASVSTGLSVMQFEERSGPGIPNPDCTGWSLFCPDSIHSSKETLTVGIPVEILFSPKLWYVGTGIRAWANLNLHRPMTGISSVFFFGGGPTRARERRPGP